jgi:hypothetical protein
MRSLFNTSHCDELLAGPCTEGLILKVKERRNSELEHLNISVPFFFFFWEGEYEHCINIVDER